MAKRCLYIETKSEIKRYVLGRDTKPLVFVRNRLYRCDDELMIRSNDGNEQFVCYRVDSTQPKGSGKQLDTNITMAYIRIARNSQIKNSVSILGTINQMNSKTLMWIFIGGIVIISMIMGGI